MKSARHVLWFLLAIAMLFGVAACVAESTDDGLNPQPLPPGSGSETDPREPNDAKNSDQNGAGGSSGTTGSPPPDSVASDAGAGDGGKKIDTRWSVPKVPR